MAVVMVVVEVEVVRNGSGNCGGSSTSSSSK